MKRWWTWLTYIGLVSLLFIAIPLKLSGPKSKDQLKLMFSDYITKFNKSYENNSTEYETRFQNFQVSLEEIDKLNAESFGPEEHKARYGLTRLSDMSKSEYKEIHLSDQKSDKYSKRHNHHDHKESSCHGTDCVVSRSRRAAVPLQVDWRAQGVVGPVRNQGLCGACWAFSTVGVIESMAAINSSELVILSVQEAIDCAGEGNSGCLGGDICLLLDWLLTTNTPMVPDKNYPLKLTGKTCGIDKSLTAEGVRVKSFTCNDFVGDEYKIVQTLATHGPVAVAVNALTWQNYLGGVVQFNCPGAPEDLNHAVELVGYNMLADVPYYIAKNSWGVGFGDSGYINIALGSNMCGLANEVAIVDVK